MNEYKLTEPQERWNTKKSVQNMHYGITRKKERKDQ